MPLQTREELEALVATEATALNLSNSAAAEWKLLRNLTITIVLWLQSIFARFQKDVTDALENKQPGGLSWYKDVSLNYQHGDTLVVDAGALKYATLDLSKRVVSNVSAKEILGDALVLKVAKLDTQTQQVAPLSTPELAGFKSYINQRRFPGTRINVVSLPADTLYYSIKVYYRAGIDPAALQTACAAAITTYRNNLPFDGVVYKSAVEDALMAVPGVAGVETIVLTVTPSGGANVPVAPFAEVQAGYFNISNVSSFNLLPAP